MTKKNRVSDPTRRDFLKEVAGTTAAVGAATGFVSQPPSALAASPAGGGTTGPQVASPSQPNQRGAATGRIHLEDQRLHVETSTLTAVIDKGFVTSLKSKASGEEFVKPFDVRQSAALQLLYPADELVYIDESKSDKLGSTGEGKFGSITARLLSDDRAEIVFHSWDGDGVIAITVDHETGDLIVEPSAYSSRPGVMACRWSLKGLREDCELVAPFYQGIKLKLDDPLIRDSRWNWPLLWEAGLAMLQGRASGFWIHTQDDRYRYKALKIGDKSDAYMLGMDSEAYGPIDNNLSAGGIAWRINVYQGDWKVPAARYRDWLWRAYSLQAEERRRPEWLPGLKLALSWCPGNPKILDALAKRFDPRTVVLHFSDWRTDRFPENYPTAIASESAKAFLAKGQAMGFHIAPHIQSTEVDPRNPAYELVRDFQYRSFEKKQLMGWSWFNSSAMLGVPESNDNRRRHPDKDILVKIHPGLSMWRSVLGENILKAATEYSMEAIFINVTLNSYNLHNCMVEATTPSEGMKRLIDHVASLGKGLAVGGEGRNEIIMQGLTFGQVHLFKSGHTNLPGVERTGGCALNAFLFGKLCRAIGYSGLGGRNANEELRLRLDEEHETIPTLTIRSAKEITDPNPAVKRVLERAGAR